MTFIQRGIHLLLGRGSLVLGFPYKHQSFRFENLQVCKLQAIVFPEMCLYQSLHSVGKPLNCLLPLSSVLAENKSVDLILTFGGDIKVFQGGNPES